MKFAALALLGSVSAYTLGDLKALLQVELPPQGQEAVRREFREYEQVGREFEASPAGRAIQNDFNQWAQSQEVQGLGQTIQQFGNSADGQRLGREVDEAVNTLDRNFQRIPNGFRIDNARLPEIDRQFADIANEINRLQTTQWKQRFDTAINRAVQQANFQAAVQRAQQWSRTP